MEYLPSFRDGLTLSHEMTEEEFEAKKFGLPKLKKYPMPDAAHVRSAIKFFNYVTPSNEAELARAILARMEEYGISPDSMNIGDENRFKKYIENTELKHHGILGMKWGVRRYQNPDGSLTEAGKKRFIKKTEKAMNRLDYIQAQRYHDAKKLTQSRLNSFDKLEEKARSSKYQSERKQKKLAKKAQKLEQKSIKEIEDYNRRKEEGEKEMLRLMDSVHKNGLKISAMPINHMVVDEAYSNGYYYYEKRVAESGMKYSIYE